MKHINWKFSEERGRKYSNKKIIMDGVTFDSKLELECYNWLSLRFEDCEIKIHPKYDLIVKDRYICSVSPDFEIKLSEEKTMFVDAKAKDDTTFTDVARIKYKLFEVLYNKKIHLWPKEVDLIRKFCGENHDSEC